MPSIAFIRRVFSMAEYVAIKAEIEDLLNSELGVGHFLASLADGSGPATPSLLLGEQLSKSFTAFYSLREKLGSHTLDCAFLALTKSGRSTPRLVFAYG